MEKIIPQYHTFFNPILKALKTLGGSGSIKEINDKVIELSGFSNDVLERLHDPDSGNETEIEYRLAWARTYLKKFGLINNSSRGVWALTDKAENVQEVNPDEIMREVRDQLKRQERIAGTIPAGQRDDSKIDELYEDPQRFPEQELPEEDQSWRAQLHRVMIKGLEPAAFERLVQRILRESGFVQVEVTGKTGDGGIDGKGIARIHGLMSFHVIVICWEGQNPRL